jgi:hypothetical protein
MTQPDQPNVPDELAVTPDPARAEALRARLHDQMVRAATPLHRSDSFPSKEIPMTDHTESPKGGRRMLSLAGAVLVVGGAIAAALLFVDRPDDPSAPVASTPSITEPAGTTSITSTTTPSPTTTLAPLSDPEIATAALLHADDFETIAGVGMHQLDAGPFTQYQRGVAFDRALAEQVPACEPYLDAAFESRSRPAVTDARFFWMDDTAISMEPQYVVVFPDETAAKAMFDATADPDFLTGCAYGYLDVMLPTFDETFIWFPYWRGQDTDTELVIEGDQSWYRTYGYDITDPDWPGRRMFSATVRVGRVVTVITVEGETDIDPQAVTNDEFEAIVARFVERAEAAQANQPPP